MLTAADITVAIPTFGREKLLLETVRLVAAQTPPPGTIIVLDQTPGKQTGAEPLDALATPTMPVCRRRLAKPSQPAAMNVALRLAQTPIVLFLDDDVIPGERLLEHHARALAEHPEAWAVAGQVLQPGESAAAISRAGPTQGLRADLDFAFRSTTACWIASGMAGNLAVRWAEACAAGGFDENFRGAAYRFETEFCRRLIQRGGRVRFEPAAGLRHLRAGFGGGRQGGGHLASASPRHGVGDYYFALRCGSGWERLAYIARRPFREVRTRFHLRHPWWIPAKLVGELRALLWALRLYRAQPRCLS